MTQGNSEDASIGRLSALLDASSHLYKRVCPSVRPYVCPSVTRYFWFVKKRVIGYSSGVCVCVCACACVCLCTRDEDASIVCLPNLFVWIRGIFNDIVKSCI